MTDEANPLDDLTPEQKERKLNRQWKISIAGMAGIWISVPFLLAVELSLEAMTDSNMGLIEHLGSWVITAFAAIVITWLTGEAFGGFGPGRKK